MVIEEMLDDIFRETADITNYWKENSFSSKKIRKEVEYNFFRNEKIEISKKFAYFYGLDKRIREKYSNILKILIKYFPWKNESKLLSKIKKFLKCPDFTDVKSIILKKSEDIINGENCFINNSNNKNGLTLQSNLKDKIVKQKDKVIESEILNKENNVKNVKDIKANRLMQDSGLDDMHLEFKDEKVKTVAYDQNFYNLNQEQFNNDVVENDIIVNNEMNTREKIEIPKDELFHFDDIDVPKRNQNIKVDAIEQKINQKQVIEKTSIKNNEINEKKDNIFIVDNNRKQDNKIAYYDQQQNSISNNLDTVKKPQTFARKEENLNNYYNKTNQNNVNNYKITEQQRGKIAGEEIAKISEKDMQAIKDVMQEEMNRQMKIAEERGEVYKLPISIKEIIDPKVSEKSEVQINQVQQNSVLRNKK